MLRVEGLSKRVGGFSLEDISFDVAAGDYFVLLGPSAAGKTVLLEILAGIVRADSGRVFLGGRDITREKIRKRKIGLVFQDNALFPHMTVWRNIAYGIRGDRPGKRELSRRVEEMADRLGVSGLLGRYPANLSGGEAQRVALARALATEPACLLLDEPLGSLDTGARSRIRSLLRRLNRQGVTMIHVTHDYEEAVSLATRIGVLEGGRIAQVGSPSAIFRSPATKFVAEFTGMKNFFRGRILRGGPEAEAEKRDGGRAPGGPHGRAPAGRAPRGGPMGARRGGPMGARRGGPMGARRGGPMGARRGEGRAGFAGSCAGPGAAGCAAGGGATVLFVSGPVTLAVPAGSGFDGFEGFAVIRSEDVSVSLVPPPPGAGNVLEGMITEVAPARHGIELLVDAGVEVTALVSGESARLMDLCAGKKVFLSMEASAVRLLPGGHAGAREGTK